MSCRGDCPWEKHITRARGAGTTAVLHAAGCERLRPAVRETLRQQVSARGGQQLVQHRGPHPARSSRALPPREEHDSLPPSLQKTVEASTHISGAWTTPAGLSSPAPNPPAKDTCWLTHGDVVLTPDLPASTSRWQTPSHSTRRPCQCMAASGQGALGRPVWGKKPPRRRAWPP